jgi:hypothetical protein
MSQRERWVVYPLLFLALGLALRDKLVPPKSLKAGLILCDQLEVLGQADCRQLTVHDAAGQTMLVLGADNESRYGLFALRPGGKRLVPLMLYAMPGLDPEDKGQEPPQSDGAAK